MLGIVPDDAPFDVEAMGRNPSSVVVTWAPPLTPNGVITSYTIYINYTDGSPVEAVRSESSTYTVTNLQPHQLIFVKISASTSAGEGPKSEPASGRSTEEGKLVLRFHPC